MPQTHFQKGVARILIANRTPESRVAGGAVINRGERGLRYSDDLDIFHDVAASVTSSAEADAKVLQQEGYSVEWAHRSEGFYRAFRWHCSMTAAEVPSRIAQLLAMGLVPNNAGWHLAIVSGMLQKISRRNSTMTPLAIPTPISPPPTLVTADEFMARYTNIRAELVKGIVKEYPMPGLEHGKICMTIGRWIANHVDAHDLGHVMSNDSSIKTGSNPDTVRGADVCFFSYERLPKGKVPAGLGLTAPDLVVEVRSPSDRWNAILAKVSEYLAAGVRVVVVLDPSTASLAVYRDEEFAQTFHNSDVWTLPDVLPGFSVVVNRLFE